MLSKVHRLKRGPLFVKTLSAGKVLGKTPGFTLLGLPTLPHAAAHPVRFGIVVSRKVSNRANKRHKVRRRLREICRTVLIPHYAGNLSPYRAIVLIARPDSLTATYHMLKTQVIQCMERL